MAKLAYCESCKATYPLSIVSHEGSRSSKSKEFACPLGHTDVREVEESPARDEKK
ncbi:MAG TPA: hypothetical protein VJ787_03015 [Thermoleophilia bacterium]|nr:hypothetical protein [Thermoleophilia bacterium]